MASKAPLALLLALLAIAILLSYEVTDARDLARASKDTTQNSDSAKEIENTITPYVVPTVIIDVVAVVVIQWLRRLKPHHQTNYRTDR